jgi:hypothetical protein
MSTTPAQLQAVTMALFAIAPTSPIYA